MEGVLRGRVMRTIPGLNFFFFILLPVAPIGLMEALDGRPPPISSVG